MLREARRRDAVSANAYAAELASVAGFPFSGDVDAVAAALFVARPPCSADLSLLEPWRRWRDAAVDVETWTWKRPPSTVADEIETGQFTHDALALHWLHGLCGVGPWYSRDDAKACKHVERARARGRDSSCTEAETTRVGTREWLAWDALLMVLSCALGVHTLIFDASANDNGLFHEELVDYDVPGAWPALREKNKVHALQTCLPPFGGGRDLPDRRAVLEYWRSTGKVALVDPFTGRSKPCELVGHAAIASTPLSEREALSRCSRRRGCYLACAGALSEAYTSVTIDHGLSHEVFPVGEP